MSTLTMLLIVWGVLTVVLVLLLIYRSTLSMHQDEQLFLDDSSKNLREEQEQVQARMKQVTPWVRILGSGLRAADSRHRGYGCLATHQSGILRLPGLDRETRSWS